MFKRMCVMAAVMFGLTACGVDAQAPEDAPVQSEQEVAPPARTTPQNAEVPIDEGGEGGGCWSHCDGKYCWICRVQSDGRCGCFLA